MAKQNQHNIGRTILTRQQTNVDGYLDIPRILQPLFWHFAHRLYKAGWLTLARRAALHPAT